MEHFVDWKRQHSYAKDSVGSPFDDKHTHTTKQKTLDDEQPLVYRNDESVECAHPPPLLMQKPVAAWALGGLGVLFLLVVGLVVRGGTMHGVLSVTHLTAKTNTWMEMLPTDVEKALLEVMNLGRPLIGDLQFSFKLRSDALIAYNLDIIYRDVLLNFEPNWYEKGPQSATFNNWTLSRANLIAMGTFIGGTGQKEDKLTEREHASQWKPKGVKRNGTRMQKCEL
ncbi:unnamed protein product [Peronospora belbahrii]|uniref:Uncharacterized protein n=1 Tax=Peronospora belbahrii TaxID=622444 RepID=A0ABN8CPG1_9STRA|nr:unnamed protein product [Peronospora belbahrii]